LISSALQRRRAGQDLFELGLHRSRSFQLLLDLDGLQPRQLTQPDFEDVFGLAITEP
jgi:hypothetical protein